MSDTKIAHSNRYNEISFFEDLGNQVIMSEHKQFFMRYSYEMDENDQKVYTMVDPSGGPYIALGMDLNYFFEDGRERIVEKITFGKDTIIFDIKQSI